MAPRVGVVVRLVAGGQRRHEAGPLELEVAQSALHHVVKVQLQSRRALYIQTSSSRNFMRFPFVCFFFSFGRVRVPGRRTVR